MRVNLLDEKEIRRQIRWDQIFIVIMVIVFLVIPAFHYYLNYSELKSLEREKESLQAQIEELQPQEERYYELQEQIREFELPEEIVVTRYRLQEPLEEFSHILPEEMTFVNIDYEEGNMSIQGYAGDIEDILSLAENIYNSDMFDLGTLHHFTRDDHVDFFIDLSLNTREELP